MTTRSYADLPDEYFEQYVHTNRELCSKTLRIWGALITGQIGQGVALSSLFEALIGRPLMWLIFGVTFLPFVIYMGLVFIRVPPPIAPHDYRQLLLLVICWFGTSSLISMVATPVWSHTARGGEASVVFAWVCILVGLTAVVTLAKYYNKFRNQELEYREVSSHERGV